MTGEGPDSLYEYMPRELRGLSQDSDEKTMQ